MLNEKTYCPMPFVTLTANPGNYVSRCMMSLGSMGPIEHSTYSNDEFQTLRTNMINGTWDKVGCESCFYKEQNGIKSQRQKWLERQEKYLGETGLYESNLNIDRNKIYHLYMNFNNICNFKCRMCGPWFSNAWIPDWKKIDARRVPIPPKQQVDTDKFLQEFGEDLTDLRQIWITGGEPFMDNSVYEFFDKLKEYCDLGKINVTVNTNASKVDVNKLHMLKDLKKLHLNISVDATGEIYNYIRAYNYDFDQLNIKIKEIQNVEQDNILLTVNGAFQIYNILDVEDFWNWEADIFGDDGSHWIEYRVLTGPKQLQARHAPDYIKEKSKQQVHRLLEKFPNQFYLPDLLTELEKPQDLDAVKHFIDWNDKLDNVRQAKELDIVTEIKDYWRENL